MLAMDNSVKFLMTRVYAALCVVLLLVFTGVSTANIVDHIQHQPGSPAIHKHILFSVVSRDTGDDHAGHHNIVGHKDKLASGHQPGAGHHHHHGDVGTGLPALASGEARTAEHHADTHVLTPDRLVIGLTVYSVERPPKGFTTSV